MRQGDPLSPLLFCIAEEVLSRGISKLVEDGKVKQMSAARQVLVPSHCFYADDLMLYCKANTSSLEHLKDLFVKYAACSGQIINNRKSSIHAGGISDMRLENMVQLLGFSVGSLPFTYLGAPIFKGRSKASYFQPIADRIKVKLSAWKASLLSIAGRVQLVKSVVQSMLIHTMTVYSWPISLLREIEKWIKNFIWSGDINKRKLVTVAWKKMCADLDEGGLGIRSLIKLNEATNLKMCWDLLRSKEQWAHLLRSRVLRTSTCIRHHIFSSIWSGIKQEYYVIKENSSWIVGNGETINFWLDDWCGAPLSLNLHSHQISDFPRKLCNYIQHFRWCIPEDVARLLPNLGLTVSKVIIPQHHQEDMLIWKHTASRVLTLKDAFEFKKNHFPKLPWTKAVWSKDFPPSKSLLVWRLMLGKLPADENLSTRGCYLPSTCSLCGNHSETSFHLFFECLYAVNLWCWFASLLNKTLHFQSVQDIWSICNNSWNPQCKVVITATMINIINSIWYARNQMRFNDKKIPWKSSLSSVLSSTALCGNLSTAVASSSISNFVILKKFNVTLHPPKAPRIIEVIWSPPPSTWVKCNTDGSSTNLVSSCGGVFRDTSSNFLLCFAEFTGNGDAYYVELSGAMRAIEIAKQHNWNNLWLECDSSLVIQAIRNKNLVPWKVRNRWEYCMNITASMNFMATHVFREGNVCADSLASFGSTINHLMVWLHAPDCIKTPLARNKLGMSEYRFLYF